MLADKQLLKIRSFIKFIHLDSIRGRIIYSSAAFVLLLFVAAYFSSTLVSRTNTTSINNSFQRQQTLTLLTEITDSIWEIETTLQQYLVEPNEAFRISIISKLDDLLFKLPELNKLSFYENTSNNDQIILLLGKFTYNLDKAIRDVIKTRQSKKKLYPAVYIDSKKLLPVYAAVGEQVEISTNIALVNISESQQDEILNHFKEIKLAWSKMSLAYSQFSAGLPGLNNYQLKLSVRTQKIITTKQAGIIQSRLDKLDNLRRNNLLINNQNNSLNKLKQLLPVWLNYHQKILSIHASTKLRKDKALMQDEIMPMFKKIWITIKLLSDNTAEFTSRDIVAMRTTSDKLSNAIWILAFIGALTTILGILIYEYAVLRPITNISEALNAEATGTPGPELIKSSALEINSLVNAFATMRRKVNSRQKRLQAIFDNAAEGIVTIDKNGVVESFNAASEKLFLYAEKDVVGKNISILVPDEHAGLHDNYLFNFNKHGGAGIIDSDREVLGKRSDGSVFPMSLKVSKIEIEGRVIYSALVSDISERKAMIDHLKNIAERDTLTGLSNRYHFQIELERVVHEIRRDTQKICALLYIDLDNFKYINDTLGHAAGDMLLSEVADILGKRTRRSDLVSRIGGDEFTLLIYDTNYKAAQNVADNYQKFLSSYVFNYKGNRYDIGCSIGVAIISNATKNADEVLSQADFACHLAKSAGKNRIHMFNPESKAEISNLTQDISWSRKIRDAIENNQFYLVYQPVINADTLAADYFEVLVRLKGDNQETIMPNAFIRTAERFGLAPDIDKWVIKVAIHKLAQYHRSNPDISFTINLSGKSVSETGVLAVILQTIESTGVNPEAILFEVTETAAIADITAANLFLAELRDMGCKTAIDDFGAGMSSFTYLQDLPVDIVKIDGKYTQNLENNPVNLALLNAMNSIAHALDCKTVIEYVEDKATYDLIKNLGIDYYQGFYFQKPAATPLYVIKNINDDNENELNIS
jgi:diguanylate cyclase (GGDEF)-like protein/PAS domain S-box-containing protein